MTKEIKEPKDAALGRLLELSRLVKTVARSGKT